MNFQSIEFRKVSCEFVVENSLLQWTIEKPSVPLLLYTHCSSVPLYSLLFCPCVPQFLFTHCSSVSRNPLFLCTHCSSVPVYSLIFFTHCSSAPIPLYLLFLRTYCCSVLYTLCSCVALYPLFLYMHCSQCSSVPTAPLSLCSCAGTCCSIRACILS